MRLAYFSPVPWASFRQRPHEFVSWFNGRFGGHVLWIDPYPVRLPRWQDLRRPSPRRGENDPPPDWLIPTRVTALPVEPFAAGRNLNRVLFWPGMLDEIDAFFGGYEPMLAIAKPSELARAAQRKFRRGRSLYDAMDDFSAFHDGRSRESIAATESAILRAATWRMTSSTRLAARMQEAGLAVQLVHNGLAADRLPEPAAAAPDAPFGYVGTVAAWFDWAWIAELAEAFPTRRIEIFGPVFQRPPGPLPQNVVLGPALAHHAALDRMRTFAAGLIPFRRNELTDSVDAVKFYEYRGLGLPVISTPFGEMRGRGTDSGVLLTEHPAAVRDAIGLLAGARDKAESVAAFRRANDWASRFEPLAPLIQTR